MLRRSALLARVALSAASAMLVFLAAELALRVFRYTPAAYLHTNRVANGRRTLLLDCYPSNPRAYFDIDLRDPAVVTRYRELGVARVEEAAATTPFAVERRYNSRQFRGPEIPPKAPGRLRVIVIGDSFTEGMGVKEDDAYPRALGRRLDASDPGRFEVVNGGRRGYDFPSLFDLFETVLAFEPDIVVYGMVLNDAVRTEEFQLRQAALDDWILDRGRMFRPGEEKPVSWWRPRLFALVSDRLEVRRVARQTTAWYRDLYGEPNRAGWERTQAYLVEMNRRMKARGGSFLIASWPILVGLDDYPFADVSATIERFCVQAGIPYHDLRAALEGPRTESLWVHPVDHHPNDEAHGRAAASLAPVVRALRAPPP